MTKTSETVLSRDGQTVGTLTGSTRRCQMEGCTGVRMLAKWPDGKRTWPCTKGMVTEPDGTWRIG